MKGSVSGEWAFIFAYCSFLVLLGVIFSLQGSELFLSDPNINITAMRPTPPPPSGFDPITTLIYIINNIGFLFSIAFYAPFSGVGFLGWITIVGAIVSTYILFRLVRGGG